jgi:hypothetical protein
MQWLLTICVACLLVFVTMVVAYTAFFLLLALIGH